jgi:hypothetical protein
LPCIACDQNETAFAEDMYNWSPAYGAGMTSSILFPTWANTSAPEVGDSGHPIYVVINNELVLIGAWAAQFYNYTSYKSIGSVTQQNNVDGYLGCQITVGSSAVGVMGLMRLSVDGVSTQSHTMKIVTSDGTQEKASGSLTLNGVGKGGFGVAYLGEPFPVLSANTTYYLLCHESYGGDNWDNWPNSEVSTVIATDDLAASSTSSGTPYTLTTISGSGLQSYGPVGLWYYVAPHSGTATILGESTAAINAIINPDGYSVTEYNLSGFPGRSY